MHEFLHIVVHAIEDCLPLLPLLFLTVFLMEYLEHRAAERFVLTVRRAGRFGPLLGAGLGCIPQCGFSAACAELFNGGLVSAGTVAAVFLSTSDEAVPILLANPNGWREVGSLLGCKFLIAIVAGFLLDVLWPLHKQQANFAAANIEHECHSDSQLSNVLLAAVHRTLEIFLYLFLFTFGIALLIEWIGEEALSALLLPGALQPMIAAVIGLIPNCAASVLLTQLYLDGIISFGAAVAGLCSSAGVGLLVLLRGKRNAKDYVLLLGTVLITAILSGLLLQLIV